MPRLITLNCPACGAKIAVNEEDARYTCQFCGKEQTLNPQTPVMETPASPRPAASQPADVYIEYEGQSIRLVRRWFQRGWIALALFCFLWDGFLVFWYGVALRSKAPVTFFVFPILHVITGVVLTYVLITGLVNRTEVTFDRQQLKVWHGPLPWWGGCSLPLAEVRQLYTKAGSVQKNGRSTYNLFCLTRSGRPRKLLSGLDSPDTALFIEQQIEAWLNLPDQAVQGEIPR